MTQMRKVPQKLGIIIDLTKIILTEKRLKLSEGLSNSPFVSDNFTLTKSRAYEESHPHFYVGNQL